FGLYFYGARWYDDSLGRFNQPDTIIPEQSQGVQAWDRFAYSNNNPVFYTDPSGHSVKPPFCLWCNMTFSYASESGLFARDGFVNSLLDMAIPLLGNIRVINPAGVEVDPLSDTVTFGSEEDYASGMANNTIIIGADVVPIESQLIYKSSSGSVKSLTP